MQDFVPCVQFDERYAGGVRDFSHRICKRVGYLALLEFLPRTCADHAGAREAHHDLCNSLVGRLLPISVLLVEL